MNKTSIKLGVNIDHIATLRNARGTTYPCPIKAAKIAEANGADGITAHLREDRRHIKDADMFALKTATNLPLNMEMANTAEMVDIAIQVKPYIICLVPERREEVTTEGGLNVIANKDALAKTIETMDNAGILVSLFIDPDLGQLQAAKEIGTKTVEFHTGSYCHAFEDGNAEPTLKALTIAAQKAVDFGITVNAGHGLHYDNLPAILRLPGLNELNIGHSIIAKAVFTGLGSAVAEMKALLLDH